MTDEWTLKTKAMDIKTVNTDLSKETCPVDNEQSVKVSRHLRDSVSVTKYHDQKASWGRKGLFNLYLQIIGHHWRKSGQEVKLGRNLEAGADLEAFEGCCLLACSSWLAQPTFL